MTDLPYEAWKSEIEKAMSRAGDEGMTAKEVAKVLGLSVKSTLNRLHELNDRGKLLIGRRRTKNLSGMDTWTPVYRIKGGRK